MQFLRVIRRKRSVRAFLAAAFLFVLFAEWGSHAVICSDDFQAGGQSMSAVQTGHEDPCQTLVLCSDNKQKDRQTPSFSHEASQHNGLVDVFAALTPKLTALDEGSTTFDTTAPIFRPPEPPFNPPKRS